MTPPEDPRGLNLLDTPEPAFLGPERRLGTEGEAEVRSIVNATCNRCSVPPSRRSAVLALVLLWHDHLDASHRISQGIENADGSFIHAMMHRREPDYGNSKYWWRRVGAHPVYPELGRRAADYLHTGKRVDLAGRLVAEGEWSPSAFVDACETAAGRPAGDSLGSVLRGLQRIEFEVMLQHLT